MEFLRCAHRRNYTRLVEAKAGDALWIVKGIPTKWKSKNCLRYFMPHTQSIGARATKLKRSSVLQPNIFTITRLAMNWSRGERSGTGFRMS